MDATYDSAALPDGTVDVGDIIDSQDNTTDNAKPTARGTEPNPTAISQRKLDANRENGRKSKGPKTIEGKRRSSQNAITHGLLAKRAVITVGPAKENEAEFYALLQELRDYYQPHGVQEELDLQELAIAYWKKARAVVAEAGAIQSAVQYVPQFQSERRKDSFDFSKKMLGLAPSAIDSLLQNSYGIDYFLIFLDKVELELKGEGQVDLEDITGELLEGLGVRVIGAKKPEILQSLGSVREKLVAAKSGVGRREALFLQAETANLSIPSVQTVNNLVRYTAANDRRLEAIRERLERNRRGRGGSEVQQPASDQSETVEDKLQ